MLAMSILRSIFNCMSDRNNEDNAGGDRINASGTLIGSSGSGRIPKVKFGVPLHDAFKTDQLPSPLKDLLVCIARDGVSVTDLFRRPGNPTDIKRIVKRLTEGRAIVYHDFNFYTLANVAKRFLLQIPGGILGAEAEHDLLSAMELQDDQHRFEAMHLVLSRSTTPVHQLLALLFGIWFRMIYHTDVNTMSVEAVAKSVAGSIFHSCSDHPSKVEKASKVMEVLITGFASAELFGYESIEYFTKTTATGINRLEKFKYEFVYPANIPREEGMRLFVAMLLEEAVKHRFDVVEHAVSEAEFITASAVPTARDISTSTDSQVSVSGKIDGQQRPYVGQVTQVESAFIAGSSTAIAAELKACHSKASESNTVEHGGGSVADNRTLRFSHKRSCKESHSGGISRSRTPSRRFNSVKRRQLERLAKRSDWFLSPPTGAESDSLIRVTLPLTLATSGPDLLESTAADSDICGNNFGSCEGSVGDSESWTGCPSSEPSMRRRRTPSAGVIEDVVGDDEDDIDDEDEAKNEEEISEIRYFVVERYYGPDGATATPLGARSVHERL